MQNQLLESIKYLEEYANTLTDGADNYWNIHRKRFQWTANLAIELTQKLEQLGKPVKKILDIGSSYQTILLERIFPDVKIDTLGFYDARYAPKGDTVHIPFDLNDTFDCEKWPSYSGEKYDIIVMLEVIEHLYTSPKTIFSFLSELMQPHGFLVVQTPNAVSLSKRLDMLRGRNPYELIRETRTNPGHFREYTNKEMCQLAEAAGLEVVQIYMLNYFNNGGLLSKISNILPRSMREGMTLVLRKKI
jgi:cyclopropane fatty-acyl-phospholipid synthase-like methyltransferase